MSERRARTNSFRAVLFDLDGTLIDSVGDIAAAVNAALAKRGLRTFRDEEIATMIGAGARTLIERAMTAARTGEDAAALDPREVDDCYRDFLAKYEAAPCTKTGIFPGGREAIADLKMDGIALGVVTNKPHGLTERILELLGVRGDFGSVVGASDRYPLKPAPDMILASLEELDVPANQAVMVGDSAADVGSARAAGIPSLVVTHGYTATAAGDLGADETISGFGELAAALHRLSVARP